MQQKIDGLLIPKLRFPEFWDEGEWEEILLGRLGQTISGLSGKSGDDFGEGQPFVTYKQVFDCAWIDFSRCGLVKIADSERQNTLRRGDVLFTTSSETPDEVGYASVLLNAPSEAVYLNSFCFSFRPNYLHELIPEFSRYLFHSSIYRKSVIVLAQGSTRFNISKSAFLKLSLPIPKEREQQKIADCLSSISDRITAETQKLDTLKAHKKGLMQQLFPAEGETLPKLRFPEFRDDWKDGTIDNLAIIVMGNAFKSSDFVESGIQLVRMGNLYQSELQLNRMPVYLPAFFSEEHSKFLVKPLDLMMSMTGTVGKKDYGFIVQVPQSCKLLLLNQRVIKIASRENCVKDFLLQLLKNESLLNKLYSLSGGTKQANLSAQHLKDLEIKFPSLPEQQKIADCLSSLDELIAAQTQKIDTLKTHKKGLMQQLFPSVEEVKG